MYEYFLTLAFHVSPNRAELRALDTCEKWEKGARTGFIGGLVWPSTMKARNIRD
jgi:hypothetical protein